MPVAVAKMAQVAMVASASEAGTGPAASCSERNRRSRMLPRSMIYPMNPNCGIEISTALVITEYER